MSQLLIVSPCPNCGTDASKNNKVLYEGIFLICHNCGYGWYYNIELVDSEKLTSYNSKSNPLNTLHNTPNIKKSSNTFKNTKPIKSNRIPTKHYNNTPKQNNTSNQFNNQKNLSNKANYASENTTYEKKEKTPQPINYNSGEYNSNIYYSPTESYNSKTQPNYTKPENSYEKPTSSNKHNNNNSKPIKIKNLSKPYENNIENNNVNKNSKKENSQIAVNLSNNSSTKNNVSTNIPTFKKISSQKNTIINFNNLQNHKVNNKANFHNNPVNEHKNIDNNSTNNNIKPENKNNNLNQSSESHNGLNLNNNLPINNSSIIQNKSNLSPDNLSSENIEKEKILNNTNNKIKLDNSTSIDNNIINSNKEPLKINLEEPHKETLEDLSLDNKVNNLKNEDFVHAINEFNSSVINKKQLGLNSNILLSIEEKAQYNIKSYKPNPIKISELVPDFKNIYNNIKKGLLVSLHSVVLLFTRLDLLLRFIAYSIIIGGSIGFLIYLNHKKHQKINQSNILNASYNSNLDSEANNNLEFDNKSNLSGINPLEKNLNSTQPGSSKTIITNDQNNIVAFEKQNNYKENLEYTNNNSKPLPTKNDTYIQPPNSVIDKIKTTLNNSFLAFKQIQQNTFSNVKIFQNNIKWQGEYNNSLISSSTILNSDSSNSYLIKSLEVTFLGDKGNTIGKRIIVTNQLINNNSAIELNLQLNNPPNGTNNVFVSIKDKHKL